MQSCIGLLQQAGTCALKSAPVPLGIWTPSNTRLLGLTSQPPKRHLGRFSRFCTAHPCTQHTHTDTQTTLRATSAAIGRIYALRAGMVA